MGLHTQENQRPPYIRQVQRQKVKMSSIWQPEVRVRQDALALQRQEDKTSKCGVISCFLCPIARS